MGGPILFDVTDPAPPCPHCGEPWHMAERADQCPSGLDKRRLYALEWRLVVLEGWVWRGQRLQERLVPE